MSAPKSVKKWQRNVGRGFSPPTLPEGRAEAASYVRRTVRTMASTTSSMVRSDVSMTV